MNVNKGTITLQYETTNELTLALRVTAMNHYSTLTSLQRTMNARHSAMLASVQRNLDAFDKITRQTNLLQSTIRDVMRANEKIVSTYVTATESVLLAQQEQLRWTATQIARLPRIPTFAPIIHPKLFETPAWILEADRLKATGWFPHSTFPRQLLERNVDDSSLDELVLSYYRDNWASIRQTIENELSTCDVERDTKETLREALHAHEQGLYRVVPSSLFSAIERAVRVHLCANRFGSISVNELLGGRIGNLPMSMLPYGSFGYVGYTQLSRHLYENIRDETTRKRFMDASVPNRHATIHGLVIYSSEKSSLNAIFVAMYVFRALTVLASGVPRRN